MKIKERRRTGFSSDAVQEYETAHRKIVREAAAQCVVLLKNENNLLPVSSEQKVALFGNGAIQTVKGGGGSGDVHVRDFVTIYQGLKNAGFFITTENWLLECERDYQNARLEYRQAVLDKVDGNQDPIPLKRKYHMAYQTTPFTAPAGQEPIATDARIAIIALRRTAGEGLDRFYRKGDYLLTDEEEEMIYRVCALYPHVILSLNCGGMMDLSFVDSHPEIESILYIHQPGQEVGNAFADVITGKVTPSGKMADTWAWNYEDYPSSAHFSHNDGDLAHERYEEGIYVGYRYFDTFEVPVRYSFGYGLSYTTFTVQAAEMSFDSKAYSVTVKAVVTNTGDRYSGKEVVSVYASCPQGKLEKEYRRLVGFGKTKELQPGESGEVNIVFPVEYLASYSEQKPGWILEQGRYVLYVGNSLAASKAEGSIVVDEDAVISHTEHVLPLQEALTELKAPWDKVLARREAALESIKNKPEIRITAEELPVKEFCGSKETAAVPEAAAAFVERLTVEEMIQLVTGEITSGSADVIGGSGTLVPGAAGQTSSCAAEKGLASAVLSDGPAGLRLQRKYHVVDGEIQPITFEQKFADGFFNRYGDNEEGEAWYQNCTAIPTGTSLAQSWDTEVVAACGKLVAEEMVRFGVQIWLAPGMNIHRNPLCGRNFEYFSEDPVLTGIMAAAMANAVQAVPGLGVTMKHMACNNAEDNRFHSDSIVSERALREIYLKGFEIGVKNGHPKMLMSSYNKINGIHAANSYDLCTKVTREEWGFDGMFVTDWTTTQQGPDCTASGCMRANNDLIMPGHKADHQNLREELEAGTLSIEDLKRCAGRIVNMVWTSNCCEAE